MTRQEFEQALQRRKFVCVQRDAHITNWAFAYGSAEVLVAFDWHHECATFTLTLDVDRSDDRTRFIADSYKNALEVAEIASEYVEAHQVAASSLHAITSFAREV